MHRVFSMEEAYQLALKVEEKKVKFAFTKPKGHAMIWLDHVQKTREKERKDKIRTWSKMEKNLWDFFFASRLRP